MDLLSSTGTSPLHFLNNLSAIQVLMPITQQLVVLPAKQTKTFKFRVKEIVGVNNYRSDTDRLNGSCVKP